MENAKFRFTKATTPSGFLSTNTASTDALNALAFWQAKNSLWKYSIETDTADELVVLLMVPEADYTEAALVLHGFCDQQGVKGEHIKIMAEKEA